MVEPVKEMIRDIAADKKSGASELAVKALDVLKGVARSAAAADTEGLIREIRETAGALEQSRPSMAALRNCMRRVIGLADSQISKYGNLHDSRLGGFNPSDGSADEVAVLRRIYDEAISRTESEIISNKKRSVAKAADFIEDGAVIVTCSYSSTLNEVFREAAGQGKKLTLLALESQSGEISYGNCTLEKLEDCSLNSRIVADDAVEEALSGADYVMLGADTVYADGSVLNGYPSRGLALAATRQNRPVYIICDSSKLSPDSGISEPEKGFEIIPANAVAALITETGLITCNGITDYLKRFLL
ncbi:translation initiation factor eIF-2B subunit delta [Anaerobium acetethylicum]|uniref:Translation initiation factor eIF-2B subunit delta n=1 Tax=Anaerobium acetethylicum TaxID=1619234 RepID=A0A1D3TN99_9FIRM|nr:translation initiation factor eIF-2B subunit delta [Anaerobium acetethylicum]